MVWDSPAMNSAAQQPKAVQRPGQADPKVTVLTLTYNRSHTCLRVYSSLCCQTYRDFEWLVIDDGSEDGTSAIVEQWRRSNPGFEFDTIGSSMRESTSLTIAG